MPRHEVREPGSKPGGVQALALSREHVAPVPTELRRGAVEREDDVASEVVSCARHRAGNPLEGRRVRGQVRGEAALVAHGGGQPFFPQHGLQRVENLDAAAQGLAEARRADRQHHELLDVDVVVGVRPAVEDVHHRDGEPHLVVGDAIQVPDVTEQGDARGRPPPPWPPPAIPPGWRSLPDGPCSPIRPVRPSRHPRPAGLPPPCPRWPERSPGARPPRRHARPCRYTARGSPSRISRASREPVDAPEGARALPRAPPAQHDVRLHRRVAPGVERLPSQHGLDDAHGRPSSPAARGPSSRYARALTTPSIATSPSSSSAIRSSGQELGPSDRASLRTRGASP